MIGLMKSLAIEFGRHGIRANAILPGPADDAAALALFLCCRAAHNVTGQVIRLRDDTAI